MKVELDDQNFCWSLTLFRMRVEMQFKERTLYCNTDDTVALVQKFKKKEIEGKTTFNKVI